MPARGWHADYIGAPYVDAGTTPAGWDCWGLIKFCLQTHFGLDVPAYDAVRGELAGMTARARRDRQAEAFTAGLPAWRPVADAAPGVVVLFTVARRPVHVGLCLHGGQFLHVDRKIETCVESLTCLQWARRIEGFYTCV